MDNIKVIASIRQEKAHDYPSVYDIHTKAFKRKDEARLTDRLRLSDAFIPELSLVATIMDDVVGHILFTKVIIKGDAVETTSLALAPMAVRPDMQRKGIGSELIRAGFKKARELDFKSVIVLGHTDYYSRFGFKPTSQWKIQPPFNVPVNVFMGVELVESGLKDVKGVVRYAKEFAEL